MKILTLAAVCHAVNAAYCLSMGDASQPAWADAPEWQKASAVAGVEHRLANPDATPEDMHNAWLDMKVKDGWVYGEVKDADKKTHPCVLPYADLPAAQKAKDYIFSAIVTELKGMPDEAVVAAPAPAALAIPPGMKVAPVKYIGKRESYRDGTFGTGIVFAKGQTCLVPADAAALMVARHPDVYVPGELAVAQDAAVGKKNVTDDSDTELQIQRDSIATMTKDALATYAKTHFRMDLDKNKKVGELREEVTRLLDQYGLTD